MSPRKRTNPYKHAQALLELFKPIAKLIDFVFGWGEFHQPRRSKGTAEVTMRGIVALSSMAIPVGICSIIYFTNWLHNKLGLPSDLTCNLAVFAILAITIGVPILLIVLHNARVERYFKGLKVANIDMMTGVEFEQYLQRLLTGQGYKVQTTPVSGDLGVDLIALKNDDKIAIQAKRYSNSVSRRAISDAVAGMYHYDCNKAMVITNNYFSPGAVTLARSTGCILIDRDTLANWIADFQKFSS